MTHTNFSIFKNKYKKTENQPDYKLSAKNEKGEFIEIGAGWIREMKDGSKYISCKLNENRYPTKNSQPNAVSALTDTEKENIRLARERAIKEEESKNIDMDKAFSDF